MPKPIPTYPLSNLSNQLDDETDVFLLDTKVDQPKSAVNVPFRLNYYGIGICISGKAELKANLETYTVEPGSLVILPPQVIRQFVHRSDEFRVLSIFFTLDFISINSTINIDRFPFFELDAVHVFRPAKQSAEQLETFLRFIKHKYDTPHPYRQEILRNAIHIVLYDLAALYHHQATLAQSLQTRNQTITAAFKKLINQYFLTQRSVAFYATTLSITPKHLSETVKQVTGKTAGEWIASRVIMEAKVLLQISVVSIAQIANQLHFADQSTFGKFFKNNTGMSPMRYRLGS
ncbi:AraC family transcriptional regulator [Spirosoma linguale]|uniref:Transcriptional regulator, AraC family n=1 Tax=Spirosoma linguale (strain ATCC 33905 / DSM 74 / LMG 10896 / Claus 1) TaxID=504472 RepID=D2QC19_SPILD|nr:transcriptional regulator, AraC family [Spirosoma linguale DSM 74]